MASAGREPTFIVVIEDKHERADSVYGPFPTEAEARAFGVANGPHFTVWPMTPPARQATPRADS